MEIGQLEAFLQAAALKSFTRAADALYLTQPSLSSRIQALEQELGERLFVRAGRGVRLSDAGLAFLPYAERAIAAIQEAKEAVSGFHNGSSGKLRLAVARTIGTYVLPDILHAFRAKHPSVEVAIRTGRSQDVLEMVLSGEVHLGMGRFLAHPEIQAVHLYDEEVILVTHPTHPLARTGKATVYDISKEPLILYDKGSSYYILINGMCQEAGVVPNVVMDLDNIEATKKMVEQGIGISWLPRSSIRRELELGTLAHVEITQGQQVKLPTAVLFRNAKVPAGIVLSFFGVLEEIYNVKLAV